MYVYWVSAILPVFFFKVIWGHSVHLFQMIHISKRHRFRAKLWIQEQLHVYVGTIDLVAFEVFLGSVAVAAIKLPVTRNVSS